jgi:UDP-N-acetyl-2-amino-2-deoxyglucuronate dehydrogenase
MIKVAILGTGAISSSHIEAYLKFYDQCQIVALVDLFADKAQAKARQFDLDAKLYADISQLIQNADFDLASICLPPFAHADAAIDLMNAGKHVLTEKPMAPSLEECDQMIAAAKANDRLLSVVAQNRFKTPTMKLKKLLDSGLIGKILHAQVDSFWWRGRSYYDLWWRGTWEKEGGGCTMNHAVHHIDLFQWMMGMPDELQSMILNLAHDNSEVEDMSITVMQFNDGRVGQLTASLVHHGEDQQLVFQGEKASVAVPWKVRASKSLDNGFPAPDLDFEAQVQAAYEALPEVIYTGHEGQIANVLAAIAGQQPLLVDGVEGRKTMELVTAIYHSGNLQEKVKLPYAPTGQFYTRQGVLDNVRHFHKKTTSVDNFSSDEITLGSSYEGKK